VIGDGGVDEAVHVTSGTSRPRNDELAIAINF
jgi:hypothetical protein